MEEPTVEVLMDEKEIEAESEKICRWAAARAGVIVIAPLVGTMTLMANEIYMVSRLAKLRGVTLSEGALIGFLGSLGATFVGQTIATIIPFPPIQVPLGMSITYAVGKVAYAWLKAGQPEDIASFQSIFEDAKEEGMKKINEFKHNPDKDKPLGDESKRFEKQEVEDSFAKFTKKADDTVEAIKDWFK